MREGFRYVVMFGIVSSGSRVCRDWDALATATTGFSGAELAGLLREAGLVAIERGLRKATPPRAVALRQADLQVALEEFRGKRA